MKKVLGPSMVLTREDQLNSMDYLNSFIQETLRLNSPVPGIAREALETVTLKSGYKIEKNSAVYLSFNALHRNKDFWKNPEQFDPERFMPESKNTHHTCGERPIKAFSPFGGGERLCLGQFFAIQEAKVVMTKLLASGIHFRLADDANIDTVFACTIKLVEGLPMILSR
jgi:cytochrome P450 / NADPH-cytochrome P450 reductase